MVILKRTDELLEARRFLLKNANAFSAIASASCRREAKCTQAYDGTFQLIVFHYQEGKCL